VDVGAIQGRELFLSLLFVMFEVAFCFAGPIERREIHARGIHREVGIDRQVGFVLGIGRLAIRKQRRADSTAALDSPIAAGESSEKLAVVPVRMRTGSVSSGFVERIGIRRARATE